LSLSVAGALTGTPTALGNFNFTVNATDGSGCMGTKVYSIQIGCPTITLAPATLPGGTVGTAYSQTITTTAPGVANCNFQVIAGALPAGLLLNGATGQLSGTPTTTGMFSFTIRATCFGSCIGTRAYTLTINQSSGCPTITLPALSATGAIGQSYSGSLAGTAPAGTYNFTVTSGALPPGLTLNNIFKVVSGTPTTAGTYNFTLTARRADGCTGSRGYTITIASN
jgi:hypothetical protein